MYHIYGILKKLNIYIRETTNQYSIEPVKSFLKELGNPQEKLQIIHISGTKGKSSICYYSCRILQKFEFTTGMYISPHIKSPLERIQVNEIPISLNSFIKIILLIKEIQIFKKKSLSIFEIMTIVAFHYFYQKKVDFVLLETGVGGRLDSTNCIKNPIACLISPIDVDHTSLLGKSIKKITIEKSGIIKRNSSVYSTNQKKDILNILKNVASLQSCKFSLITNQIFKKENLYKKNIPSYKKNNLFFSRFVLSKILPTLSKKIHSIDIDLYIAGRYELLGKNIILDVAHNMLSIRTIIKEIKKNYKNSSKKIRVIFSCLKDKNEKKLSCLFPTSWYIYFYKINPIDMYENKERIIKKNVTYYRYERIIRKFEVFEHIFIKNKDDIFLITGSFHIVSLFRRKINKSTPIQNIIYTNSN